MNNTLSIVQIMKSPRKIGEAGEAKEDKIEMVSFKDGCGVWQYGLWSFQAGNSKLKRFCHKYQHTQRKLLNFEF